MPTKFKSKETISSSEDESDQNFTEPAEDAPVRSLESPKPARKANGEKSARPLSSRSSTNAKRNVSSAERTPQAKVPQRAPISTSEEDDQLESDSSTRSEGGSSVASSSNGKRKSTAFAPASNKRPKTLPSASNTSTHGTDDDSGSAIAAEAGPKHNSGSLNGGTSNQHSSGSEKGSDTERRKNTVDKDGRKSGKKDSSAAQRRPVHPFHPPAGFGLIPLHDRGNEMEQILSQENLDGKELLHFLVPSSIPIASLTSISDDRLRDGGIVLQHNGVEYELKIERNETLVGGTMLLPASERAQYETAPADVSRTFVLQQAPRGQLPVPAWGRMQVDSRNPPKQPGGLKTRYWPPGFELKIASGSTEDDADATERGTSTTYSGSFKDPSRYIGLEGISKGSKRSKRDAQMVNTHDDGSDISSQTPGSDTSSSSTGNSKSGTRSERQRVDGDSNNRKRSSQKSRTTLKAAEEVSQGTITAKRRSGKSSSYSSSSVSSTSSSGTEDSVSVSSSS